MFRKHYQPTTTSVEVLLVALTKHPVISIIKSVRCMHYVSLPT